MKRIFRDSPQRALPALTWSVVLMIALGLILPSFCAAATVKLKDITKVSIVAFRDKKDTTLVQRVFVSEDIALPCTVTLPWKAGDAISKSQQSDGDYWFSLSTTLSNGTLTYTLTKGRIAEFESPLGDIYEADGNALIAAVPVTLATGIKNVEVGCTILDGYECVYPDAYRTDFRSGTYEQIAVTALDMSRGYKKEEVLFGFEQKALPVADEPKTPAPLDFNAIKGWPWLALLLLVLAIIFSAVVTYIISKNSPDDEPEHNLEPETDPEPELEQDSDSQPGLKSAPASDDVTP